MKKENSVLTFAIVGCMAILLCLPEIVAAGGSPNPPIDIEDGEKIVEQKQGVLIAVWTPCEGDICNVDSVLRIGDYVYYKELLDYPETDFTPPDPDVTPPEDVEAWFDAAALALTSIAFPNEILEDFGRGNCNRAQIAPTYNKDGDIVGTKDVQNLAFKQQCFDPFDPNCDDYVRILHCDVKVSFICETNK
jgi:hypothetical protein